MDSKLLAPFLMLLPSSVLIHHPEIVSSFSTNGVRMKENIFQGFLTFKTQILRLQGLKWLHLQEWLILWITQAGRYLSGKRSYWSFKRRLLAICLHSILLWVTDTFYLLSAICWLSGKSLALPLNWKQISDLESRKHLK